METVAVQSWYSRMSNNWHPCFYEQVNGRMKRVSVARGRQLIEEGILPMTDQLKQYFEKKKNET